ncbi:calcium:proton antiporter [Microbacterium sp. NPDC055910]|uniref:calcium:proton antiporter n=1 Tax=Microbacterium sp. NPDC055910 TaxID=3345659 RepID=UPI0035E18CB2
MQVISHLRAILTPAAILQLLLGWIAFGVLVLLRPVLQSHLSTPTLFALLAGIIAVIVVCAFGVVAQAEHLARRLGDPYGTLILTLSIVVIEVILISAVMLGPGEHPTIARDSVMAVSMIILNLVVGVALVVGGIRHGGLRPNRTGVSSYLSLLIVLLTTAFALPALIGVDGAYTSGQAVLILLLTVALYVFFLWRQMGAQRDDFREVLDAPDPAASVSSPDKPRADIRAILKTHRVEVLARTLVLVLTVVPIVLLSHDMASLLDEGLGRLGAPVALSGILIAMIVFLPETITTISAAYIGEIQRVSNLCHGALVSTVGVTIPAVLAIGLLTGQIVVLAESPVDLALLAITVMLSATSFLGRKTTALHGGAHLMVFVLYGLAVFS